jgi:hypothetical protein
VASDPFTALTVDLAEPDLGIRVAERLDLPQGAAPGLKTRRHFHMEAPGTIPKEELPASSDQHEILLACEIQQNRVHIVYVDLTGQTRHGPSLRLVALV